MVEEGEWWYIMDLMWRNVGISGKYKWINVYW